MQYVVIQGFGHKLRTTRWRETELAIPIFVRPPPADDLGQAERIVAEVMAGIREWEGVLGHGLPTFELVDDSDRARLEIIWMSREQEGEVFHLGEARYLRDTHDALKWDPDRYVRLDSRLIRPDEEASLVSLVAAHEMGHVLGLSGHSDEPNDAMYAVFNDAQKGLTDRDRATASVLYSCPRFAVWVGPRPPEALSGRYSGLRSQFDRYRVAKANKAFAILLDERQRRWAVGWAAGQAAAEAAIAKALERCEAARGSIRGDCELFAVGDELQVEKWRDSHLH